MKIEEEVKYAKQRYDHPLGIDDLARWNAGNHISKIAVELIRWLKENKHGFPASISGMKEEYSEEDIKNIEETWDSILDKIIWAFEALSKVTNDEAIIEKTDSPFTENEKKEYVDLNLEIIKQESILEGMSLFVQYAEALWD